LHSDYKFKDFNSEKFLMSQETNDSNSTGEEFSLLAPDQEEPHENGGDFFSQFYFDKLVQDIKTKWDRLIPIIFELRTNYSCANVFFTPLVYSSRLLILINLHIKTEFLIFKNQIYW